MPKKSKGRGNRGRGRGNNGQDHQQPRPGRRENGAAAVVLDREENRNLDDEESERTLDKTSGPSQRTSSSRSQESADTARSNSEEKKPIPSARTQDERPGPSEISLRPQTAPFAKPATNAEKCEQSRKPCAASPASEGKTVPPPSCGTITSGLEEGQEVANLAAKLGSSLSTQDSRASSSDSVRPPKRPGFGTVGRRIALRANFFRLTFSPKLTCLYHYDVEITPNKCPKDVKRDVVNEIIRNHKDTFKGHQPGFDGEKNLISFIKLPSPAELKVTLPGVDGGKDRTFQVL